MELWTVGLPVYHIMSDTKAELHPLTSAARIVNGGLSYAGEPLLNLAA